MKKRTLSVSAINPASKKTKARPTRAAAQRASTAVQDEARHVEKFDEIEPVTPKKKVAPSRKKGGQLSKKKKAPTQQTLLTSVNNNVAASAAPRDAVVPNVDDTIVEGNEGEETAEPARVAAATHTTRPFLPAPPNARGGRGEALVCDPQSDEALEDVADIRRDEDQGADETRERGVRNPRSLSNVVELTGPMTSRARGSPTAAQQDVVLRDRETAVLSNDAAIAGLQRRVQDNTEKMDEVLFRLTAVQSMTEELRAKIVGLPVDEKPAQPKKEKGIEGWNAVMEKHVPNVADFFGSELWREAIMYATMEHLASLPRGDGQEAMMAGITAICSVLLARNAKKDIFETAVGKSASMFRFIVLTRALTLARSGRFAAKEELNGEKPFWLGMHGSEHYILKEHISLGQEYHETKQSNTATYARRVAIGNGADRAG